MRPDHFMPFALLFLAAAVPTRAADYYVCDCAAGADPDCVAGSDLAVGTDPAQPWQSYHQARSAFAGLAPGESIRFCRGGVIEAAGGGSWVNNACLAANPCVVSDYQPPWAGGDEARPVIRRVDDGHGFSLADGGDAEHEEGYRISNLVLLSDSDSGNGVFLFNDIDDVTLDNLHIEGFGLGVHVAGANPCSSDPECDGHNDRVILSSSTIIGNAHQGWLGGSDGSRIERCYFEGNGSTAVFDHNIYLSSPADSPTVGMAVVCNRLYRSCLDSGGACQGVSLVGHGRHQDLLIEGNEVWEDVGLAGQGCWGIAIDNGYNGTTEGFTNLVIRGNTVRNVGNTAIGIGACADCTIESNTILHEQDFGLIAIAVPDRSAGPEDLQLDAAVVRNNSIWVASGGGTGIRVQGSGSNHLVVSNAVRFDGTDSWRCLQANLDATAYLAVDHNLCLFPNTSSGEWEDGSGTSPDPLTAWQQLSGLGGSSQLTNPGFADPAVGDLRAASPAAAMVGAGHPTLSSPDSIEGCPRGASPDAGAHQHNAIFGDRFESGSSARWSTTID